jgi:hypothetical protein
VSSTGAATALCKVAIMAGRITSKLKGTLMVKVLRMSNLSLVEVVYAEFCIDLMQLLVSSVPPGDSP